VVFLVQAVAVLVMSSDFTLPITTSFLSYIEETGRLGPETETVVNLPLGPMVAVFLFLGGV